MRTFVLARNELIKARHAVSLWVAFGSFGGLAALIFLGLARGGARPTDRPFVLPGAWADIIGGPGGIMTAFFAGIVLILLVSNEFMWRTSRQNVIDGLSKEEFFAAKLLLIPGLVVLFFGALLVIGGIIATTASRGAPAAVPTLRQGDLAFMGGAAIGLLGWGSLAFLVAVTIRSPGPAIGAFILYFVVEQVVADLVARLAPSAAFATRFVPTTVFRALWDARRYGVVPLRAGQGPAIETPIMIAISAGYAILLVAVAFALYRRRDL
jgi:ABC-2 type transport system permease protein